MLALTWSCSGSAELSREPTAEERAIGVLQGLAADAELEITQQSSVWHADGAFAFVKGALVKDSHSLAHKVAIYSDLKQYDPDAAYRRRGLEHWERWGRVNALTVPVLIEAGFDAKMEFLLIYSKQESEACQPRLDDAFEQADVESVKFLGLASGVTFVGTGFQAIELSRVECVFGVMHNEEIKFTPDAIPGDIQKHSSGYTEHTAFVNASRNLFGRAPMSVERARVGLLEPAMDGSKTCLLDGTHEALAFSKITYIDKTNGIPEIETNITEANCTTHSDCGVCLNSRCDTGKCRSWHASTMASRISSSTGQAKGLAAEAEIFYVYDYPKTPTAADFLAAYESLISNGATVINESQSQETSGLSLVDQIRDFIIRRQLDSGQPLTVVKSAGNYSGTGTELQRTVDCASLNAICVGATDANDTYRSRFLDDTHARSRYLNPYAPGANPSQPNAPRKEVERPDVVSEGDSARVLELDTATSWREVDSGSSAAAATITGMIAVCSPHLSMVISGGESNTRHFPLRSQVVVFRARAQ